MSRGRALAAAGILAAVIMPAAPVRAQTALEWVVAQAATQAPGRAARHRQAAPGGRTVLASWYGGGERLARRTANGEVFHPRGLTAAHRSLPFGTRVAVSYRGRTVVVRINDRGPARHTGRSIDLSRGAAVALGFAARGTAHVRIAVLGD